MTTLIMTIIMTTIIITIIIIIIIITRTTTIIIKPNIACCAWSGVVITAVPSVGDDHGVDVKGSLEVNSPPE